MSSPATTTPSCTGSAPVAVDIEQVATAIGEAAAAPTGQARRLFHGRGGCFPGLEFITVDDFHPLLWIVLFREPEAAQWERFLAALSPEVKNHWPVAMVQRRYERGAPAETLWGELPEQLAARERDWLFQLKPGQRQNIGYFMDMSTGRDWLVERVQGRRVLNLFAYTCAFSVAAVAAGAEHVVNVDMSRASLDQGRDNHRLNAQGEGLRDKVTMLPYNLFRSWKRIRQLGPYDLIIIDPPSRQRGSFDAEKDYARVLSRLPELANAGAEILACLNAPYLDSSFLRELFDEVCPQAEFVARLPNRADFPDQNPEHSLKLLHYHWPESYLR